MSFLLYFSEKWIYRFILFAFILMVLSITSIAANAEEKVPGLETVPYVDLNRYVGKWFHRYNFFEFFHCRGTRG
jgi:hypothetical protein